MGLGSVIVFTFMSGGRTGQSMFNKIKEKIPIWQNECGAAVAFQLDQIFRDCRGGQSLAACETLGESNKHWL